MPKRYKLNNIGRAAAVSALLLLGSCGAFVHPITLIKGLTGSGANPPNPDVYHVGTHGWVGDSIWVRVYHTSEPAAQPSLPTITADCRSCNLTQPAKQLAFSSNGTTHIYFPEARQQISARIHLHGSGIDTTFIQTQRSPKEAMEYFHLSRPLVGRVLVGEFAPLYLDTTQDSVVTNADIGDELNIYGERSHFFVVQHPNFSHPLYLFKGNAVRLY